MKTQVPRKAHRVTTEKLSISMPKEMAAWLRRSAAKRPGHNISLVIRDHLMAAYQARNAK